ncbi:alkane 1-monooxygenase [Sulfitobacter aestuarii]|uniref:Alkane 1-monooxygenase n=1 Tax=Sulfitobacter aestuarii TaxID=2161676 RepID=A0ABW5TZY8_9RHOB
MFWFYVASLTPALLLGAACIWGGGWVWAGLGSITLLAWLLDRMPGPRDTPRGSGRALSLVLVLAHFLLMFAGIRALGGGGHLSEAEKIAVFIGLGLFFGQISNSNAHELIHAGARLPRRLGAAVYVSLLHGHHVSAHLLVHHVHAASDGDPNSARRGEGFWRFALRAMPGEFMAGWRAEQARHQRRAHRPGSLRHPYLVYLLGAAAALSVSLLSGGPAGLLAHLGLALYAQMQLLLSDYVQHYGLRRAQRADGRLEPVGPAHSWNAPSWYSAAMMLNAPRHSDHHLRPARSFPELELCRETMPQLPRSLPVMAVLALAPPLWRRVMDRRVARWQDGT